LPSQALALLCMQPALGGGAAEAAPAYYTPPSGGQPHLSAPTVAPCLPPAALTLGGALPSLPASMAPPLRAWEALRCGADGVSRSVCLVRACAWERLGDLRLASLHASLQLRYHTPAEHADFGGAGGGPPLAAGGGAAAAAAAAAARGALGQPRLRPTTEERLLAACKLAWLRQAQQGEAAALRGLLAVRHRCGWGDLRAMWLQHAGGVLLTGALERGERRRASELLVQLRATLAATDGPSDAAWHGELELMLQDGRLLEAVLRAEALARTQPTGRGAGTSAPQLVCVLIQARAHLLGGSPVRAHGRAACHRRPRPRLRPRSHPQSHRPHQLYPTLTR
jgi:hypothetical protein